MNHIRWAAWGVVDIEALERMQRRNYIKRARAELAAVNITLHCGGSTRTPYYQVVLPTASVKPGGEVPYIPKQAFAGVDAFKKACEWTLQQIGEGAPHVGGEDGGVRSAGAQA